MRKCDKCGHVEGFNPELTPWNIGRPIEEFDGDNWARADMERMMKQAAKKVAAMKNKEKTEVVK